jgi:RND family efflux transporter MFP subunit
MLPSRIVLVQVTIALLLRVSTCADQPRPEGFTEPLQTIKIAAEPGVVDQVLVCEGDAVLAGDVIAQLRCEVLKATLDATTAKLRSTGNRQAAAATLAHRTHHLNQLRALFEKNHASDQEVAEAEFNVQLAKSQLQTADDQLEVLRAEQRQIQAQLDRQRVVAPIDGIISHLPVHRGERVGNVDQPVAELVCLHQLRIRYHLPTDVATKLSIGSTQTVYFPETKQQTTATVDFIAPTTNSSSGTVRVELLIDNQDNHYRAGVRCQLMLASDQNQHELSALLKSGFILAHPSKGIVSR